MITAADYEALRKALIEAQERDVEMAFSERLAKLIIEAFELEYGYNPDPSDVKHGAILMAALRLRAACQRATPSIQDFTGNANRAKTNV
jgi:hypothetical protein